MNDITEKWFMTIFKFIAEKPDWRKYADELLIEATQLSTQTNLKWEGSEKVKESSLNYSLMTTMISFIWKDWQQQRIISADEKIDYSLADTTFNWKFGITMIEFVEISSTGVKFNTNWRKQFSLSFWLSSEWFYKKKDFQLFLQAFTKNLIGVSKREFSTRSMSNESKFPI